MYHKVYIKFLQLYRNYWCETEEEKNIFRQHLRKNEIKHEDILQQKYKAEDLFKNCKNNKKELD